MDIFYNVTRQCRVDEDNCRLAGNPVLYFGACPEWTIHLYTGEPGETPTPLDMSGIPAFRAAVDVDWTSSTTPMCRTVSGINVSQAEDGIITVPIDADTVRFGQVLDGARSKEAYFELRGLDTDGNVVLLVLFPVTCHNVIDPDGGEPPADTPSGYATEAYVDAVVSREIFIEFSADGTSWHTTLATGDLYERIKHGSTGEWSDAFAIPWGPRGPAGQDATLIGSSVNVTSVDSSNNVTFTGSVVPAGVKAPSGTYYPVEKTSVTISSSGIVLNFDAFLAYEGAASFSGTWTVYFSGGIPEVQTIIASGASISPQEHQVFQHDIASGETISISSSGLSSGECMTFELWLDMPSTAVSFTLPTLTWVDGAAPDFTEGSTRYAVTVRWNGTKFLANLAYKEALA